MKFLPSPEKLLLLALAPLLWIANLPAKIIMSKSTTYFDQDNGKKKADGGTPGPTIINCESCE